MPTYIQTDSKLYKVQPLGTIGGGVELQHSSGWFEVGDDNGRIMGNSRWKWFTTDKVLDGPQLKNKEKRKNRRNKR